ncbi:hypothetical protein WJX81_005921 [Elliptochloris bilobata]|uniref:Uncharacterized protein n=1 Tax=Elliptochloris bilobata TaxID=381761 RepID=A0AAW1QWS6_9CHLO
MELREAAADGLCQLAAEPSARQSLADQGAIGGLAAALVGEGCPEVRVRILLALAMLIGGTPERARALADAPGAGAALMALVRAGDDEDCRQIAAGLVAELAKDSLAAAKMGTQLQASQAADGTAFLM